MSSSETPPGVGGPPGPLLRFVQNEKIAFLLVGATNTVVGFLFFVGFQYTVGVWFGYIVTLLCAHVASVIVAFLLYRRFVFRVSGHFLRDLGRFELVNLTSLGVNLLVLPLLVEVARLPVIPAQALIVFITTLISFFGHKGFSFRRTKAVAPEVPATK